MSNKEIKLEAELRTKDENITAMLKNSFVPGIVYGHDFENKMIKVSQNAFAKVYSEAGESHLIDLEIKGQGSVKVIIKDFTKANLKNLFTHFDLFKVSMTEKITTEVELLFVGESKAVKDLGGTLVKAISSLEIRCLPGDLLDNIEVDISKLNTFDDQITIADLKLPKTVEILHHELEDSVALVTEVHEEIAAPAAPAETPAAAPEAKK